MLPLWLPVRLGWIHLASQLGLQQASSNHQTNERPDFQQGLAGAPRAADATSPSIAASAAIDAAAAAASAAASGLRIKTVVHGGADGDSPLAVPMCKLACVMVGLPARGKTYIARKIARYLTWLGHRSRIFNVGNYRRDAVGAVQPSQFFDPDHAEFSKQRTDVALYALDDLLKWLDNVGDDGTSTGSLNHLPQFDDEPALPDAAAAATSNAAHATPTVVADAAVTPILASTQGPAVGGADEGLARKRSTSTSNSVGNLRHSEYGGAHLPSGTLGTTAGSPIAASPGGPSSGQGAAGPACVALYDATNSTADRRRLIVERCRDHGVSVMFIESICDDPNVILANIREVKLSSPDFEGIDPEIAIRDFEQRIKYYEKTYETLQSTEMDSTVSFVKLINVGNQVLVNKVRGYIQSRIVYFLMNLNTIPRSFYFSRHGESVYNVLQRIGGDSHLSPRGEMFAKRMPETIKRAMGDGTQLTVWTSTLKRTIETGRHLNAPKLQWKQLDEIDSGVCDGLTYEEIEERFPADYLQRDTDKFNYRYHGGESYRDLVHRLEPVIMELERHCEPNHSILIIGHQAVLRAIYSYFLNISHEQLPYIKVPLHTIVKLTPRRMDAPKSASRSTSLLSTRTAIGLRLLQRARCCSRRPNIRPSHTRCMRILRRWMWWPTPQRRTRFPNKPACM
ncbi:hypothetical protein BC831DRAFT_502934 [Entophlyctis helioformis]|nr:hypothetical protein BC831DRAFT_502934 [Entophlyctis helioformis]